MWDGRESSTETGTRPITDSRSSAADLEFNLRQQAVNATLGHAEAAGLDSGTAAEIVAFEMGLSTAMSEHVAAGSLESKNATGGPVRLYQTPFYVGINSSDDPFGQPIRPVFTLFNQTWVDAESNNTTRATRESILRGQALFNRPSGRGSCVGCHNTPNVGNRSTQRFNNTGIADATLPKNEPLLHTLDISYLPQITLRCKADGSKIVTTDPGRALVTGKCSDIGSFKSPILRGLAAREPYFHNGAAPTLTAVAEFYNDHFDIGWNRQQITDLATFLATL